MELARDEPRVIRELDDLDEPALLERPRDDEARFDEQRAEVVVDLVPVPVPLVNDGLAVRVVRLRIGIALGRMTMVRPLIESGMLIALFPERLRARYAHYLVYPQRAREHAPFRAFREWLAEEAAAFRATTDAADLRAPRRVAKRKERSPRRRAR